jgi:hypothetical protein
LDALAEANDFAEVINIGKTYEGRDMNVLAITKAGPGAPSVWLEAGIHAREWIAPAVATFIVRELVNSNCRLNLDKLKVQFYNILQFYFIYNFFLFYLQFYFIYNFLEALFLMFD